MPKLQAVLTTTQITAVALQPSQRTKLLKELRLYAELKQQSNVLKLAMQKHQDAIEGIRDATGEKSVEIDGFKITRVGGTTKKFSRTLFVKMGGDLDVYDAAVEEKDKKPHTRISLPGDAEEEE